MRQKYTPEMMMEEIAIAFTTGRCPRCGQVLAITADEYDVTFRCDRCKFMGCGSHGILQEVMP